MKQYLSPDQTAKLIELGFEKPKSIIEYSYPHQSEKQQAYEASLGLAPYLATVDQIKFEYAYSIGELIDILPTIIDDFTLWIGRDERSNQWFVKYAPRLLKLSENLIDALFDMAVKLKEEGILPAK